MMKKRNVGRPRDGNPAETRREILKAAEESFAAWGFAGATTRQVAAKAGVNVATLHYHFGNKEGLYRAVIEEAVSGTLPVADGTGTPEERIARVVGGLHDFAASRPALPRLSLLDRLAGPPSSEEGGSPSRDAEDPRVEVLRKTLGSLGNGTPAKRLPPDLAARWIVTLIDSSVLVAQNGGIPGPSDPHVALSREAVISAALKVAGV